MDANYSNGSSVYHGLSANLRKRFSSHYEFLASYTWSHAIDDSTDLQSTLTPQDSYFPGLDRSNSTFDQRHRFVFSGVYQSGKLSGSGVVSKFFSNWTFAPQIELSSGRPFNVLTGNGDNEQLSSQTGRPNTFETTACTAAGNPVIPSKFSPTGVFQEPCYQAFTPTSSSPATFPHVTLLGLDGNLGRNAGITPWTVFNDLRLAKKVYFGERMNMDFISDMFNIANVYNVAAVSPLQFNHLQRRSGHRRLRPAPVPVCPEIELVNSRARGPQETAGSYSRPFSFIASIPQAHWPRLRRKEKPQQACGCSLISLSRSFTLAIFAGLLLSACLYKCSY